MLRQFPPKFPEAFRPAPSGEKEPGGRQAIAGIGEEVRRPDRKAVAAEFASSRGEPGRWSGPVAAMLSYCSRQPVPLVKGVEQPLGQVVRVLVAQ